MRLHWGYEGLNLTVRSLKESLHILFIRTFFCLNDHTVPFKASLIVVGKETLKK